MIRMITLYVTIENAMLVVVQLYCVYPNYPHVQIMTRQAYLEDHIRIENEDY